MTKKYLLALLAPALLLAPSVSFAASLTQPQVNAIISLLEAFGVQASTIAVVQADIEPTSSSVSPVAVTTPPETLAPQTSPSVPGETEPSATGTTFWPETTPPYIRPTNNSALNTVHGLLDIAEYGDVLTSQQGVLLDVSQPGSSVTYTIDGNYVASLSEDTADCSGCVLAQYDTTQLANGPHTLLITATDAGGTSMYTAYFTTKNATSTTP